MGALAKVKIAAAAMLGVASLIPSAFADWRDQASDFDIRRLQILEQWRDKAIWEAQNYSDGSGDFNALRAVVEAQGRTVPGEALIGNWRCRNMKMGGVNAYIVYGWFNCRIVPMNGGLLLEKLDGSLLTRGFLYPENGAWVYLGSSAVRGERIDPYSGRTPSIGAAVTPDDQIGLLTGIGNNHLRLEIPAVQESLLDVVELVR